MNSNVNKHLIFHQCTKIETNENKWYHSSNKTHSWMKMCIGRGLKLVIIINIWIYILEGTRRKNNLVEKLYWCLTQFSPFVLTHFFENFSNFVITIEVSYYLDSLPKTNLYGSRFYLMKRKIKQWLVNNFTNIIKKNNRPSSWLTTLNTHKKTPQHMRLEIIFLTWDRHTQVAGLNWLMGSQPSPLYFSMPS